MEGNNLLNKKRKNADEFDEIYKISDKKILNDENEVIPKNSIDDHKDFLKHFNLLFPIITKIYCYNCKMDITNFIKFICFDCDFILCINCVIKNEFEKNNIKNHKNNHQYFIGPKLDFPLFIENWSFKEQYHLYKLIQYFGFGNWEKISKSLGEKNPFECEANYLSFIVPNKIKDMFILKDISYDKVNDKSGKLFTLNYNQNEINKKIYNNQLEILQNTKTYIPQSEDNEIYNNYYKIKECKQKESKKIIDNKHKVNNTLLNKEKLYNKKKVKNLKVKENNYQFNENEKINHSVNGYWIKRNELDIEFLNDAEEDISNLEFLDNDTEEDRNIKLKMLHIYNDRLEERNKMKDFVVKHNLITDIDEKEYESKLIHEELELLYTLKPLAKYFDNQKDFRDFFENILIEKYLINRINELKNYQNKGYKTYQDIINLDCKAYNQKNKNDYFNNINFMIKKTCGIGKINLKKYIFENCGKNRNNSQYLEDFIKNKYKLNNSYFKLIKNQIGICSMEEKHETNKSVKSCFKNRNTLDDISDFQININKK